MIDNIVMEIHLGKFLELSKEEKIKHLKQIYISGYTTDKEKKEYFSHLLGNIKVYDAETFEEVENEKLEINLNFNTPKEWERYEEMIILTLQDEDIKNLLAEGDENKILNKMLHVARLINWSPEPTTTPAKVESYFQKIIYAAIYRGIEKMDLKTDIMDLIPKITFVKNF